MLRRAAGELPPGSRVIIATDNDEGGDRLMLSIQAALRGLPAYSGAIRTVIPISSESALWSPVLEPAHAGVRWRGKSRGYSCIR